MFRFVLFLMLFNVLCLGQTDSLSESDTTVSIAELRQELEILQLQEAIRIEREELEHLGPSFASKVFGLSFIRDEKIRYAAVTTMYFALGGFVTTFGIVGVLQGW